MTCCFACVFYFICMYDWHECMYVHHMSKRSHDFQKDRIVKNVKSMSSHSQPRMSSMNSLLI